MAGSASWRFLKPPDTRNNRSVFRHRRHKRYRYVMESRLAFDGFQNPVTLSIPLSLDLEVENGGRDRRIQSRRKLSLVDKRGIVYLRSLHLIPLSGVMWFCDGMLIMLGVADV
ncbi:hypothetical protein IEQ34_026874 [Dendrobium chrysotoxum]|uniref:Uncharacterized protein n=1 Tax=Dendrobium chrysotoxum TaxID=161865 RepID=A0AAV7FKT0_DENCH|nr:hypothetical protein IEQ34_026874 [Dendrobium chrysotoxum]